MTCHFIYHLQEVYVSSTLPGLLGAPLDVECRFDDLPTAAPPGARRESRNPLAEGLPIFTEWSPLPAVATPLTSPYVQLSYIYGRMLISVYFT